MVNKRMDIEGFGRYLASTWTNFGGFLMPSVGRLQTFMLASEGTVINMFILL
jgi:hypothetical protein